jgi:5-methyltetrahydrofolate--homocysteine methyltransferase
MLTGGIDAILVETSQDLLQTKAATLGAKRALANAGKDVPVIVHVTVETTGTMLLGSEIGAALTALEPLGIDLIGLNCATGPTEMSEHLRHLSRYAQIGVSCMPNAGLPQLTADGAEYPLKPIELADALEQFVTVRAGPGRWLLRHDPEHLSHVVERLAGRAPVRRRPSHVAAAASLYAEVPFRRIPLSLDRERITPTVRRRSGALLAENGRLCRDRPQPDPRRAHCSTSMSTTWAERPGRRAQARLPVRHSLDPADRARLDRAGGTSVGLECLGGRAVINSVNYEDGDDRVPVPADHRWSWSGAAVIALTIDEEARPHSRWRCASSS